MFSPAIPNRLLMPGKSTVLAQLMLAGRPGAALEDAMLDIVFVAAGLALFALTYGYASLCDRL
jgi:hypothetical protein